MKKISYNKTALCGLSLAILLTGSMIAYAAGEGIQYNLLSPFGEAQQVSTFGDYLSGMIPFLVRLAAVLATVFIVIGGFEYSMSDSITSKQDAKDMITQAVIGLLLALTSYLILNTLSPNLVRLDIPSLKNISEYVALPEDLVGPTTPTNQQASIPWTYCPYVGTCKKFTTKELCETYGGVGKCVQSQDDINKGKWYSCGWGLCSIDYDTKTACEAANGIGQCDQKS